MNYTQVGKGNVSTAAVGVWVHVISVTTWGPVWVPPKTLCSHGLPKKWERGRRV